MVAFDTKPAPSDPSSLRPDLIYIQGNGREYNQVLSAMKGCDAAIHLAAGLPHNFDKIEMHNLNVVMSWNMMRAAAEVCAIS